MKISFINRVLAVINIVYIGIIFAFYVNETGNRGFYNDDDEFVFWYWIVLLIIEFAVFWLYGGFLKEKKGVELTNKDKILIALMPLVTIISTPLIYMAFDVKNLLVLFIGLAFNLAIPILLYGDYRRKFILKIQEVEKEKIEPVEREKIEPVEQEKIELREYPVSANPFWQSVSKLILVISCIGLVFVFIAAFMEPLLFINIPFIALYLYCGFKFLYKTKRIYLYFLFGIINRLIENIPQQAFEQNINLATITILWTIITMAIPVVEFYKYKKGKYY